MEDLNSLQKLLESDTDDISLTPKQAKIIEAAIELFAEKGYASTSTNEIAKKAGVSEGTIFRHYSTKKELLLSIVTPILIKFAIPFFVTQFSEQIFKSSPENYEELLRKVLRNRFEFIKQNEDLIKIFLQEMAFHPEIKESLFKISQQKTIPKLFQVIEEYKAKGQIIDYPVESIFRLTITNLLGFLITRFLIMPEYDWDDEAEMERTVQFLVRGLSPEK